MRTATTRSRLVRFLAVPVAAAALALGGAACTDDEGAEDDGLVENGELEDDTGLELDEEIGEEPEET